MEAKFDIIKDTNCVKMFKLIVLVKVLLDKTFLARIAIFVTVKEAR